MINAVTELGAGYGVPQPFLRGKGQTYRLESQHAAHFCTWNYSVVFQITFAPDESQVTKK